MATQKLSSRIDSVKIYAAGATVTRIAELQLIPGELPEQVEIAELPLALDDSSVRVRVETTQGNAPIAGDIRIGLAVPPLSKTPNPPPEEELRAAKIAVKQLEDNISLIDREISILNQLEVPARPESDIGVAPPASPMSARLALANFSDEQIRQRIQEKRENLEKLAKAKENLADLEQKQTIASTARNAKPEELRKTVIVSLSYEEGTSDLNQTIGLVLEYFVPGARWTPTYVCRLNSVENQATIAVRALICQRTGEDWSSVKLELSTANPIAWCAIPELPSLRLGKTQPKIRKAGWRKPPVGAEILFEDFDRQKESALSAVSNRLITDIVYPSMPPLLNLVWKPQTAEEVSTQNIATNQFSLPRRISSSLSPFGNKLIQTGYVNHEQMKQAMIESRSSGRPLTEILESLTGRQLPPDLLRQYKKQQSFELKVLFGVECLDREITNIPVNQFGDLIESLIPIDICRRYRLVPLSKSDGQPPSVLIAMVNPDDQEALDELNRILRAQGLSLKRMVIAREDYEQLITKYLDEEAERLEKREQQTDVSALFDELENFVAESTEFADFAAQSNDELDIFSFVDESYEEKIVVELQTPEPNADFLPYGLMRMGTADNREKRGKLAIAKPQELYLEILQSQKVAVNFNILKVVQQAVYSAQECLSFPLPPGGINVRTVAASFDYSYSADGRIDIPSDGQFHSVALTSKTTDVDVRYIVVPREDTNVFRIAQLRNPLSAPLLSGPADVYVDGEYILSTNIVTVPPQGQMELGLGVEQAIKVARNTSYWEERSGETIVAFNELCHQIKIEITNHLSREAKIEVRERLPIPQEGAKVEVQIEQVSPEWQQYNQQERGRTIRGGYRWQVEIPAKEQKTLSVDYKIKTFVDSELIGGNRRE